MIVWEFYDLESTTPQNESNIIIIIIIVIIIITYSILRQVHKLLNNEVELQTWCSQLT
jgi:hypothetical protein